jgi:AraC-like DNA-binding protein
MPESVVLASPPSLADVVEAIWQVDVPDPCEARARSLTVLPSAASIMAVHFRDPIRSDRKNYAHQAYRTVITGVQRDTVTIEPSGPTGSVIVRFKPGAAACVFGPEMAAFSDANVELSDVVGDPTRDRLQTRLREAADEYERRDLIEDFLLPLIRHRSDPLVWQAIRSLRANPGQPVAQLARALEISERQLERRFLDYAGATPKQFVRMLRVELAIAARHRGAAWADVAARCGFTDQAHMIRDFKALSGTTPEAFMRRAFGSDDLRHYNTALAMSGFYNTAIV